MTKTIPLTRGVATIVDDDVYTWASRHRWMAIPDGETHYAVSRMGKWPSRKMTRLHREIMQAPDGVQVDHINGNPLDNRRVNLRFATPSENARNRGRASNNTSGFKGVNWNKKHGKWLASIMVDGKRLFLGGFTVAEDAARAYDKAARKYHGEFARTNF